MENSCVSCGVPLKRIAKFCGSCGTKVETDGDTPFQFKPLAKTTKMLFGGVIAVAVLMAGYVIAQSATQPMKISIVQNTSKKFIWEGEDSSIEATVSFSEIPEKGTSIQMFRYDSALAPHLVSKIMPTQLSVTSTFTLTQASYSESFITKVFDSKQRVIALSKPLKVLVEGAFLPTSCMVPAAKDTATNSIFFTRTRAWDYGYGDYQQSDAPIDGSVGCGDSSNGLPPVFGTYFVKYEPFFVFPPMDLSSPEFYTFEGTVDQSTLPGVTFAYHSMSCSQLFSSEDCVADEVIELEADYHGVLVDFFNAGTLDENMTLFKEALANIPHSELKTNAKRDPVPDLSWYWN